MPLVGNIVIKALCASMLLITAESCGGGSTDSTVAGGADASVDSMADVSWDNQVPLDGFNPTDGSSAGDLILVDLAPIPDVNVVEGSTECIPDGSTSITLGACCNHEPCLGQCVQTEDAEILCSCYGIVGGCWEGSVCCSLKDGCVDPLFCGD